MDKDDKLSRREKLLIDKENQSEAETRFLWFWLKRVVLTMTLLALMMYACGC